MAVCKVCSSSVQEEDVYCTNCGNKLKEDIVVENKSEPVRVQCSRRVVLFLVFFLGAFGLHNWYLGQKTSFFIKIGVSLISYGILSPLMYIWSIVEGIRIIKDKEYKDVYGIPLGK